MDYTTTTTKSLQSCPTLCDPRDGSPPGSPVPGILQARTLEWVAISFSMKVKSESEVAQSCPTPSDSMDCSLPDSSIHGIFQARVLEWGAIAFSKMDYIWPLKYFQLQHCVILLNIFVKHLISNSKKAYIYHLGNITVIFMLIFMFMLIGRKR